MGGNWQDDVHVKPAGQVIFLQHFSLAEQTLNCDPQADVESASQI